MTFKLPKKKCTVAKSKSDLSESEETAKTRKQRKQKVMINSDSEDEEFSDDESDSMPSLSSTDDEVKKSNEKKLTISKDPGWSPLKRSVVESSYAHITSTPVNQTTNQLISDIKSLNSKSKYYHNDNGNSVPLKDDVIVQTNHSINTPFTTKTTVSPQNTVDNYNSCLNSNIIAKGDSPHLSFAKRSLFSDLDKSQNPGITDSPIKISKRTLSDDQYAKL
ncbi:uncharacterized protein LOC132938733 [Metopolophium dirhodum]|uniref:uncharacterized protein LOC132938733 n=1 Tax=Metopolophium dirhodum TaxID=44670 RepID=UPI00298FC61F|nr:uncharacterized protein LOC132938733 [Metopolophium dirhodum]